MISFVKIQGTGNDFIVVDNRKMQLGEEELSLLSRCVCRRALSLGADGLMAVAASDKADFKMHFYNADGSPGEMCGNGARCLARYAFEQGLAGEHMRMETPSGIVEGHRVSERIYQVKLNPPSKIVPEQSLVVGGSTYAVSYVELGSPGLPHLVLPYLPGEGADEERLRPLAQALRSHPDLPKGANVNFYHLTGAQSVSLKTYERGVEDFTLACGTGAASVALVLRLKGLVAKESVTLISAGGELLVDVGEPAEWPLFLTGATHIVAKGVILDEETPSSILRRGK